VSDLHGHRGLAHQSAAGQRHLRMDRRPFPVLQERAHRLEEQRSAQPFAEQMFQKSGKSSRKPILFLSRDAPPPRADSSVAVLVRYMLWYMLLSSHISAVFVRISNSIFLNFFYYVL